MPTMCLGCNNCQLSLMVLFAYVSNWSFLSEIFLYKFLHQLQWVLSQLLRGIKYTEHIYTTTLKIYLITSSPKLHEDQMSFQLEGREKVTAKPTTASLGSKAQSHLC